MHVCMYMYTCVHMGKPDGNLECLPPSLSTGFLLNLELAVWQNCLASKLQAASLLSHSSTSKALYTDCLFNEDLRLSNTGSHAFIANPLPTEPSPRPSAPVLSWQMKALPVTPRSLHPLSHHIPLWPIVVSDRSQTPSYFLDPPPSGLHVHGSSPDATA